MNGIKRCIAILMMLLFIGVPSFADDTDIDGYIVKYKNMDEEIVLSEPPVMLFGGESEIEYVVPNIVFELFESEYMPSDAYYSNQWNLDMICASDMWSAGGYGNGVRVGVIDTGIYPHKDMADCVVEGAAFEQTSGDGTDTTDTLDKHGHGTHVSSVIASAWNEYSVAGIAKNAQIVPLRAFSKRESGKWGATLHALTNAVESAVDDFDCDVINMSLGVSMGANTEEAEAYLENAINYAYEKGAIIVAAVGNEGSSNLNIPAAYENVIGVASVDSNKSRSSFSNYNSSVYVTAPGRDIYAAGITGDQITNIVNGTSFSSPTVAAVAAAAKSLKPTLTNAQFKEILKNSCEDLGDEGYDTTFGYGLVRCDLMLSNLLEGVGCYRKETEHLDGNITLNFYNGGNTDINHAAFSYKKNELLESISVWKINLNSTKTGYALKMPDDGIFRIWNSETLSPID